jgi:hypothetical protein
MAEKRVDLPKYERVAQFRSESFNPDDHTIEIVWTTGATVRRYDYWDGTEYDEVLSLEPGAVRLERMNLGAPFLDSHSSYSLANVLGSVVADSARIADSKGTCRILLSRAASDADTIQKIKDGVIRNISVGYWIHKVVKTEAKDGKVDRWDIVDWEPLEVSAVPIPADPGSQIRSETAPQDGSGPSTRSCIFVTPDPSARGPKSTAKQETRMATAPKKTASRKSPAQRLAELEAENKRLADLLAAKRAEDDKKDDDEPAGDDEDKRDGDDADEENAADDGEDNGDEGDTDEGRAGDDDDDDEKDEGERSAPAAKPGKRATLTAAEVRKAAEDAVRKDRVRGAEIRKIAEQFGYPKLGERHASGETSVRAFKDLVMERLAERQKKRGNTTFAATSARELDDKAGVRSLAPTKHGREFDKGADEMRTLLGKKAA